MYSVDLPCVYFSWNATRDKFQYLNAKIDVEFINGSSDLILNITKQSKIKWVKCSLPFPSLSQIHTHTPYLLLSLPISHSLPPSLYFLTSFPPSLSLPLSLPFFPYLFPSLPPSPYLFPSLLLSPSHTQCLQASTQLHVHVLTLRISFHTQQHHQTVSHKQASVQQPRGVMG